MSLGSTMPIEGLLTRAAYKPSKDTFSALSELSGGSIATWTLVSFIAVLAIYPFLKSLRHIPLTKAQSGFKWLNGLLHEPKAPEVATFPKDTPNKGLLRYRGLLGGQRVLVNSLEGFHEVLQEKSYTFEKWEVSKRVLGPLMGDGMLLTEGDVHKGQRKTLGPVLTHRQIHDMYPMMWQKTNDLISAITKQSAKADADGFTSVNFSMWAARAAYDILGFATFGQDVGMINDPNHPLTKAYGKLFPQIQKSSLRSTLGVLLPRSVLTKLPLDRNAVINSGNVTVREYFHQYIQDVKAKTDKNDDFVNVIGLALKSGQFNDDDLVEQLMTIMVAGHETTSYPLSWMIHYLGLYPEVQNKLRAEIRDNLPSPNSNEGLNPAIIDKLPYLHAVCNEILRLIPVVPVLYRQAAEATTVVGQDIPQGTVMAISPWLINRNKDLWGEDAEAFRPERWAEPTNPTKGDKFNRYAFSAFSHGPRQCFGINFAQAELHALVAGIVGRFEVQVGNKPEPNFGLVTVKPEGGIHVRFRELEGW